MGKAIGGLIGLLGLVVAVLTWLFPDPLAINDKVEPGPAHTVPNQERPNQQLPQQSQRPGIELSPKSGPPGTRVTVTGANFPANAEVEIRFHVTHVGEARSDANGRFTVTVRIPSDISTKDFPWAITATATPFSDSEDFKVT